SNRTWGTLAAAMLGSQLLVNGAALDWWAGEAYGMRRMTELYPLLVLLGAAALGLVLRARQGWRRGAQIAARVGLLLLIVWTFYYILAFFHWTWTHPSGLFHDTPSAMMWWFEERGRVWRWQIMLDLFDTHLGIPAWSKPGP
ncbi:MAG: hypothetical protein HC915_20180, partial [Anaerolineae bacterium]|nr:hypothetical protein [Anaerolineae bacterium]